MESTRLPKTANRKLVRQLVLLTAMMFGFGYALVPLYNVFCEVTGINGKTGRLSQTQAASLAPDKTREITVEFLTNVSTGLPWNFRPLQEKIVVNPGVLTTVSFAMRNRANYEIVGQAIPSLAPQTSARYFSKTECFCFARQPLAGGEEKTVPVRFIIDPKIPADVDRVTLSYTFFEAPKVAEPTAAVKGSAPNT